MNIADLATNERQPACWEKPDLFSASALDYDPRGEEYAHLDTDGHVQMAEAKAAAEEAAVDVCFGCPLMLACEEIDVKNNADSRHMFIAGVIGGRTEAERKARRAGRPMPVSKTPVGVPNPQIAPGDRGPRNQVDDELVKRLTIAGETSEQIARTLNCSPRTVSRARRRMGLSGTKRSAVMTSNPTTAAAPQATGDAFTALAAAATGETLARTAKAAAATRASSPAPVEQSAANPFIGGRPVMPAMEAVYNHLATVGGTDTLDALIAVGIPHVDPSEAIDWWTKNNSVDIDGTKVIRSTKADTPVSDRIREGARAKVFNAISATHRKGRYLDRDGDIFTFKPHALTAWCERMEALATTS